MIITIHINNEAAVADLMAKGEMLNAALLEAVGSLGTQLLERVRSKIAPVVRTAIGQEMFDSIQMQAAAWVDAVCRTSVGIDKEGQPSYIVAYVREFGGEKWYDIFPGIVTGKSDKKALRFFAGSGNLEGESRLMTELGGLETFARHVWHPPAEERSYLRSSLMEMQTQVKDEIVRAIAGVLAA